MVGGGQVAAQPKATPDAPDPSAHISPLTDQPGLDRYTVKHSPQPTGLESLEDYLHAAHTLVHHQWCQAACRFTTIAPKQQLL